MLQRRLWLVMWSTNGAVGEFQRPPTLFLWFMACGNCKQYFRHRATAGHATL